MDEGADVPGAVLITASLMLGVYTIVKPAAEQGWGSGAALGLGAVSLALLGALYLQRVLDYDALQLGFAFLPATLVMGTLSVRYSEGLFTRFGARRTLIAAGLLVFSRAPVGCSYRLNVLPVMVLLGTGAGTAFPALMNLSMTGVAPQDAGLASGLVNTSAQIGGALGLAILATLSATRTHHLTAQGVSTAEALTRGYHLAFLVAAGLVLLSNAFALVIGRPEPGPVPAGEGEPAYSTAS